mmetsp:Transcript_92425/g.245474  ORF Transcript_92425/g.245474 Transcript_92425/m.245474 type:complete len:306 (-) Transcript_92425:77-994(-)
MYPVALHLLHHRGPRHEGGELFFVENVVPVGVRPEELGAEEGREVVALDLLVDLLLFLLVRREGDHRLGRHGREQAQHRPRHKRDEGHEEVAPHAKRFNHGAGYQAPVFGRGELKEREERRGDVGKHGLNLLPQLLVLSLHGEAVPQKPREHDCQHEAEDEDDGEDPYEGAHHVHQQSDAIVQGVDDAQHPDDPKQPREHEEADDAELPSAHRRIEEAPLGQRPHRGQVQALHRVLRRPGLAAELRRHARKGCGGDAGGRDIEAGDGHVEHAQAYDKEVVGHPPPALPRPEELLGAAVEEPHRKL